MLQKMVAPVLCCALALSLAGCRISSPATVMTVADTEIPAGMYLLYQLQAYSNAKALQTDSTADVLKDTIEEKAGAVWVSDETQRLARRYVAIEQQFVADGFSLTQEEIASAEQSAKSAYAASLQVYNDNGVGEKSFVTYYTNEIKYDKMVNDHNEKTAPSVTDTEAKAYMDAQYNRVSVLMLPITREDATELTGDELAKVQAIADKLQKDLAAGGDMDALAPTALKEALSVAEQAYTDDSLTQYNYTTFLQKDASSFDEETTAAILAARVGEAGQAPTGNMPIVYHKLPNYESDDDFKTNYRDAIVRTICLERFDEALKTEGDALAVTVDAAAVKTYSPKKIKMN